MTGVHLIDRRCDARLFPASAFAQSGGSMEKLKLQALMGGDFATQTSQLAARRSGNQAAMTFAELEIEEQAAVALAFGSRPGRAGVRPDQAAVIEQLSMLSGPEFDAMYVKCQIDGHRELMKIHRRYARSGDDPMARGAATVAVPAIKTHLGMLRTIRSLV